MSEQGGASSFQRMQQMGGGGSGHGHGGESSGVMDILFGKGLAEAAGGFLKDKAYGEGFSLQKLGGFGEMMNTARGNSFLSKLFDMFASKEDMWLGSFGVGMGAGGGDGGGGGGGEGGGGGGGEGGSNHAFSSLPSMGAAGPASDVAMHHMGNFIPDPTPAVGGGRGMGAGMEM